eukprot:Rmarinus@m.3813
MYEIWLQNEYSSSGIQKVPLQNGKTTLGRSLVDDRQVSRNQLEFCADIESGKLTVRSVGVNPSYVESPLEEEPVAVGSVAMVLNHGDLVCFLVRDFPFRVCISENRKRSSPSSGGVASRGDHDNASLPLSVSPVRSPSGTKADSPEKPRSAAPPGKPACRYGAKCYRKNPKHLAEFWHPRTATTSSQPECSAPPAQRAGTAVSGAAPEGRSSPRLPTSGGLHASNRTGGAVDSKPSPPIQQKQKEPPGDDSDGDVRRSKKLCVTPPDDVLQAKLRDNIKKSVAEDKDAAAMQLKTREGHVSHREKKDFDFEWDYDSQSDGSAGPSLSTEKSAGAGASRGVVPGSGSESSVPPGRTSPQGQQQQQHHRQTQSPASGHSGGQEQRFPRYIRRESPPPRPTGAWDDALRNIISHPERNKSLIYHQDDALMTVYDGYPKARVHLLVLPKEKIDGLRDLTPAHLPLLRKMRAKFEALSAHLEQDLLPGVTLRNGFHTLPSMKQLHLHVFSDDFDSPFLKNKKHWNSFTTAFLIPIEEVISSFERSSRLFLNANQSNALLSTPLRCHICHQEQSNIPALKQHIATCPRPRAKAKGTGQQWGNDRHKDRSPIPSAVVDGSPGTP